LRCLLLHTTARGAAGGGRGGAGDEGGGGGDLLPVGEAKLLQGELVPSVGEGEVGSSDVVGSAGVVLFQATEEVEDQLRLGDGVADVAELVGGRLDAEAVVVNGGFSLSHGVELLAQEDGALRLVGLEEAINGDPELAGSLVGGRRGHVKHSLGDGAVDPTPDAAISLPPCGVGGRRCRGGVVDVVENAELAAHGKEV
jgi:hypothetical protein